MLKLAAEWLLLVPSSILPFVFYTSYFLSFHHVLCTISQISAASATNSDFRDYLEFRPLLEQFFGIFY